MKIISDKNLRVATTWGAVVVLEAGKERELSEEIGLLALQQGAKEVGAKSKKESVKIEETTLVSIRARNEDGHFIADDPSTPDVDEAFVEVAVGDVTEVVVAIEKLVSDGDPANFKKNGEPKAAAINSAVGRTVAPEERTKAWDQVING
tara:strand:- start:1103 stop:1549 length:447 start_codon:yes stop_codon:yes gene_type:complete